MIHLVTGGSGSGKSAYAEQCFYEGFINDAAIRCGRAGA